MNSFPYPALVAAVAAVIALPFSAAAAGTLGFAAALGAIIHADYVQRARRVRLPRQAAALAAVTPATFCCEANRLAA